MCYSPADSCLYVFVPKMEETQNLSKFLDATYLHPYTILSEHAKGPKGGYKVTQLKLNSYSSFCTYLYQLDTHEEQLKLLMSEFAWLMGTGNKILLTNLLGNLDIRKLRNSSLVTAQIMEFLTFCYGVPSAFSMLGLS